MTFKEIILMKPVRIIMAILILSILIGSSLLWAPPTDSDGEWLRYNGDLSNSRYSRLTQINKDNVAGLQIAWQWKPNEEPIAQYGATPGRFAATPLMVDDVLYLPTSYHRVVALDAQTGKELWSYDPHAYEFGASPTGAGWNKHRGVATWTDGKQRRIFLSTRGRLMALDATTGKLIPRFGREGIVDLTETLSWKVPDKSHIDNSIPPVIYKNLAIVSGGIPDRVIEPYSTPGDVQAFDVLTGKLVWIFHPTPHAGDPLTATWEDESWKFTGHANAWTPNIAVDEKRGLVYIPTTEPANDYFGGERKGNNEPADSLVCLDANTGKRIWHFQTVHHDLWDYDGVMGVNLLTIHVDGKTIDAVAAVSKTGFTYVFDRVTGKPVWPIVERPVPQSDVPGERTSPTQPFPTKPPAFAQQGFTAEDVVDFTPEIKAMALEKIKPYRSGPMYNPPSFQGTLLLPQNLGGANWGGASADPDKGILYVRAENVLQVLKIGKRITEKEKPRGDEPDWPHPLALTVGSGIQINKPPYASLTAIDLNKGEILWQVPLGDMSSVRNNPLLKGVDLPPTGAPGGHAGALVTAGGLIFVTSTDSKIYAFDKENGKVLWAGDLKNFFSLATDPKGRLISADSAPMTYRTRSGQQFVVMAAGGEKSASLIAFTLPGNSAPALVTSSAPAAPAQTAAPEPSTSASASSSAAKDWTLLLPEDAAKPLAVKSCASCHGLEQTVTLRGDAGYWSDMVWTMVADGADIPRDEADQLIKYFGTHFDSSKPKLSVPVNVNTASVDILRLFSPLASHAEEIVKTRDELKGFQKPEDLLQVKGITKEDLAKVRPFLSFAK
jgi:glucose dehydrogenase